MHGPSRRKFLIIAAATLAGLPAGRLTAQETASPVRNKRGALSGYDPVAYFTKGRPEKGTSEFWFAFDDVVYLFASGEHRAMFAKDPERYAPQYDGYCTMFLALQGAKLEPDPEAWAIHEGKLYVFGKKVGSEKFKADPVAIIDKASAAWPTVRTVPYACRFVDPAQDAWAVDCKAR